jgi:hypothetical protein
MAFRRKSPTAHAYLGWTLDADNRIPPIHERKVLTVKFGRNRVSVWMRMIKAPNSKVFPQGIPFGFGIVQRMNFNAIVARFQAHIVEPQDFRHIQQGVA